MTENLFFFLLRGKMIAITVIFAEQKTWKEVNMANLMIICGPQAVGKMTVAESLRDKLNYRLMTNHDSIEVSDKIFGLATPAQREFNKIFREKAFEVAVKHEIDLLFTYVCAFEMPEEKEYLTSLADLFQSSGGNFYLVELSADIETRIARNEMPHRLEMKATKRDIAWSKANLLRDAERHKLNSNRDEIWFEHHIKIDNTHLAPDEVADQIIKDFHLLPSGKRA